MCVYVNFSLTVASLHHPVFTNPPFRCENDGWGEFEMLIDLHTEKGGKHTVPHDLNFASPRYEVKHTITFRNPNAALLEKLKESGPVPGDDANGVRKKEKEAKKKKTTVDMDKLADGLVKLQEDDLLQVVQMIHDNKSEDTYTKNDVDRELRSSLGTWKMPNQETEGEFHVDLYTLPENLIQMLWRFVSEKS